MKYSTTSFLLLNSLVALGVSGVFGAPMPYPNPSVQISSTATEFERRAALEDALDRRSIYIAPVPPKPVPSSTLVAALDLARPSGVPRYDTYDPLVKMH
ncbi:hypothetical protein CPB83DRAFT_865190 [Crepidotus variabilis]|uniref:Uncharacterized protein n=1 Tax=Crepidotus variabilis TaxID=179855 RepID=A0A9P6E3M4_9AGAR|nr:hypothetical protein CPB83DRAFT_865190 [Crepidotus variabilis]